ncbi:hypothetical protein FLONG3_6772 [Fusarium longipes]|uniref:Uncharacterized protein n=1 Tax=Fusarium longipes TaxID=694270 RepID=A0A395SJ12_9HYPO|nr:hypothetical protein FLONG3_6772 [Fusarium longipes]
MRFSLQSLAIGLVSTQAGFAIAGPCRPLTTTSVGVTTTTATSEEVSSTAVPSDVSTTTAEEETSTTAVEEESTTTILEVSTTTLAGDETTTTAFETTTTLVSETTTTDDVIIITRLPEATTTTAAETTTTTSEPEPSLYAEYNDGSDVALYLQSDGFAGTTKRGSIEATFALEVDTSRLYLTLADGSKRYAYTAIAGPNANYGFLFEQYSYIENTQVYHFVTCTADSESLLECSSEGGPTRIYYYLPGNSPNVYGNSQETTASSFGNTAITLRLPRN